MKKVLLPAAAVLLFAFWVVFAYLYPPQPTCQVVAVVTGQSAVLQRSDACDASATLRYRWVTQDGAFGAPGEDGKVLSAPVTFKIAPGNTSHFEYSVNGGVWQR